MSRNVLCERLFTRARRSTVSDFPNLLSLAGSRVLLDAYATARSPLVQLARPRQATDFRALTSLRLSEAPALLKVGEDGEVHHGARSEAKETYAVATYGRIFSLSRQAVLNDDLSAFADTARAWGQASANWKPICYMRCCRRTRALASLLMTTRPFSPPSAAISPAAARRSASRLGAGRAAIRNTRGLDGQTFLNLTPVYLVVGPATETVAEQAVAEIAAAEIGNANVFAGKLQVLTEPRIEDNSWYLFASPDQAPVLELANLSDAPGPQIATREGWTTLGAEYRCTYDVGCGAIGWRGSYRNPGA